MSSRDQRANGPGGASGAHGRTAPETVRVGSGRAQVELCLQVQGRDLVVLITGGEAHVGAVAGCDGRPGAAAGAEASGLVQLPGHREGPLAAEAAATIARAFACSCAAVVGIHQDQATADEIGAIVANVRRGLRLLTGAGTNEVET